MLTEKSGARDKIHISNNNISHPIRNLDSIKSKKSSQYNISFIKKPYLQHSTNTIIPCIYQKSRLPRISSKNNRTKNNKGNFLTSSQFIHCKPKLTLHNDNKSYSSDAS